MVASMGIELDGLKDLSYKNNAELYSWKKVKALYKEATGKKKIQLATNFQGHKCSLQIFFYFPKELYINIEYSLSSRNSWLSLILSSMIYINHLNFNLIYSESNPGIYLLIIC
jgi:hypothetical protein